MLHDTKSIRGYLLLVKKALMELTLGWCPICRKLMDELTLAFHILHICDACADLRCNVHDWAMINCHCGDLHSFP
jgi:hypothetical protein